MKRHNPTLISVTGAALAASLGLVAPASGQDNFVRGAQDLQALPGADQDLSDAELLKAAENPQSASASFKRKQDAQKAEDKDKKEDDKNRAGPKDFRSQEGLRPEKIMRSNSAPSQVGVTDPSGVGLAPPGGIYGVDPDLLGSSSRAMVDESGPAVSVPELHVVKQGDTLWSLCAHYYGDPWRWPRLWAVNPLITNAHWIFPGDVLRLQLDGMAAPPKAAPTGGQHITSNRLGSLDSKAVVLRQLGFIEAQDLQLSGKLTGSREEKIMLSSGDQGYVTYPKDHPLRPGERYTIFSVDFNHPVRAENSREILGYLVHIFGDYVVDQITDAAMARGTLVDMMQPVERGYYVSPLVRQFRRVEPRPSAVNLEARVVASFASQNMLAAENFVVLSRGRRDGVEVGNRTFVIRRGDGYRPLLERKNFVDPLYPKEVIGELWVVDVRDTASVAWIARTSKEIHVGEITELRKGH